MDIKQLEYFVRVAELGSFTRAAATLRVSQPVLSRHVRQLELELKTHLLYRNGHGVTPTDSGKRLVAHGKGILHQLDVVRDTLQEEEISPVGKVIVGLPPSVGKLMTVLLVSKFREQYPNASIGIVEGLTISLHEWLLLGRLDVALLYNPAPTSLLSYEHVWSENLCLMSRAATSRGMPAKMRMRDLARYPLIIPSRPNALRNLIESECGRHNIALNVILEIDSIISVLDLVERGVGHAILPGNAINDCARRNAVHVSQIVSPNITSHLHVATSSQRPLTSLARKTIELVRAEFARQPQAASKA
jgi:LysR family transcriptional regulator, nitrogen assimilation regulatory protein